MNLWNFLSRKRRLTVTTTVLFILVDVTVPVMTRRMPRVLWVASSVVLAWAATAYSFPLFFLEVFAPALAGLALPDAFGLPTAARARSATVIGASSASASAAGARPATW